MLWISFLCTNKPSVAPCCLNICDTCTRIAQEKSGERYPNSVVSFGLNRAYIKIRTPNSPCTDNTWFFEYFYGFLGFVVWEISGHFWGVYQSHYCASAVAFLFSFVYVIYLKIASYLYGKQIKSKLWTKLYLWMIFICVRLNRLHFHECRPMPLKQHQLGGCSYPNSPSKVVVVQSKFMVAFLCCYLVLNFSIDKDTFVIGLSQISFLFLYIKHQHSSKWLTNLLGNEENLLIISSFTRSGSAMWSCGKYARYVLWTKFKLHEQKALHYYQGMRCYRSATLLEVINTRFFKHVCFP